MTASRASPGPCPCVSRPLDAGNDHSGHSRAHVFLDQVRIICGDADDGDEALVFDHATELLHVTGIKLGVFCLDPHEIEFAGESHVFDHFAVGDREEPAESTRVLLLDRYLDRIHAEFAMDGAGDAEHREEYASEEHVGSPSN